MEDEKDVKGMSKDDQLNKIESEATELISVWKVRNDQIQEERDRINIIRPATRQANKKWYTNEAKALFDTCRALVSLYPPKFRLPISINFDADEKDKMNKAERLCYGIYRTMDMDQIGKGGTSWLWDLAYYVLQGWMSIFYRVEKTRDGPRFVASIWDPITVYPEWDSRGMKRCVRSYQVDEKTATMMAESFFDLGMKFEWSKPIGNATIINYWLRDFAKKGKPRVWNGIVINGVLVKPITYQSKMDKIPIQCSAIGSPETTSSDWQTRKGEGITYGNRDMYLYRNAMITLMAEILASQSYPNVIEKTRTGQPAHRGEEFRGHGSKMTYKLGETVELLKNATTPEEAATLFNWTGQKLQEAGLPATVHGVVPFEMSGFALSQYMATIKYKVGPYLNAMRGGISNMMTEFLYQYKTGGFDKITLSTVKPSELRRGRTYYEEFGPDDVPERIYVDVDIPITSQFDKTQQILNARTAMNPPQIYSRETLWEMSEDIEDFEVERERIKNDIVENDPFVLEMDLISGLWNRYEALVAQGNHQAAEALKRHIFQKEMGVGMRQGAPETKGNGGAQGNPDVMQSLLNIAPSGLRRRPQTAEERDISQKNQDKIVSPGGRTLI